MTEDTTVDVVSDDSVKTNHLGDRARDGAGQQDTQRGSQAACGPPETSNHEFERPGSGPRSTFPSTQLSRWRAASPSRVPPAHGRGREREECE